jgi:hypothetical protein
LFWARDYAWAKDAFEALIQIDPDNIQGWERLRIVRAALGDTAGARAAEQRNSEEAEKQQKLLAQNLQIPVKYKRSVIFGLVAAVLATLFLAANTVWSAVLRSRQRVEMAAESKQQVW